MDLSLKGELKRIFNEKGLRPSKKLGQHFLISKAPVFKLIEAANLNENDAVVEVGSGTGVITEEILKKGVKSLIAVEKDGRLAEILKQKLNGFDNLEILREDALKMKEPQGRYKVLGNIPYYLTVPLIRKFLNSKNKPELMVLMIQKEVGERICAKPPKTNFLAVLIQFSSFPKIMMKVKKDSFFPTPKVDSVILRIILKKETEELDYNLFLKVLRAGFSSPRKQILNNLRGLNLQKQEIESLLQRLNINPKLRAEDLRLEDWVQIAKML